MCLSFGSHSSAVAIGLGDRVGGFGDARRCAANRSRKPLAACTAAATSRASVLGKYRYTVWRVTPSVRATSAMEKSAPRASIALPAASSIRAMASSSLAGAEPDQPWVRTVEECYLAASPVGNREPLDAVEPSRPKPLRLGQFRDVRNLVGDLVEDQLDLHAGQVGADAVVRAVAAEAECGLGSRRISNWKGSSNTDSS